MNENRGKASPYGPLLLLILLANAIVLRNGFVTGSQWYWGLCFTMPLFFIALYDFAVSKKSR